MMGFADRYLAKHGEEIASVTTSVDTNTRIIVIIPAYNESRLHTSLDSLFNCHPPGCSTEVLILVNWPEYASAEIKKANLEYFTRLRQWITEHPAMNIFFHALMYPDMPTRHAGVGLARKTLMDEAVRRFQQISCPGGVIASFDADSVCDPNYLTEIEKHFQEYPRIDGCTIYFEHPLSGDEYSPDIYKAIALYELHLRYYLESIRFTGYPNAYHTVGSSFAVRAGAYCSQGGMNKRKAGEDFYFLQKFLELGSFNELNTTRVSPSPRPSDRVPFGTGAAISRFEKGEENRLFTYNPAGFEILREFFARLPEMYDKKEATELIVSPELYEFLKYNEFNEALMEIIANSASFLMFEKRFFRWLNLFRILKFLNSIKNSHPDVEVCEAAHVLISKIDSNYSGAEEAVELLWHYRKVQRGF